MDYKLYIRGYNFWKYATLEDRRLDELFEKFSSLLGVSSAQMTSISFESLLIQVWSQRFCSISFTRIISSKTTLFDLSYFIRT